MDCAGPFQVKRGRAIELHYLLLLTCCKTRAVRLELLTALSLDAFLMAFTRATERGVRPSILLTDNGTNFQAAHQLQGVLWSTLQAEQEVLGEKLPSIKWRFNPSYASHWGGVFERLIGATKRALYHALPSSSLSTLEQLQTAFAVVEGALNSRPLAYHSGRAEELTALTPNHFLYGSASRPVYVVPDGRRSHLARRWLDVQQAGDVFWERLQKEIRPWLQSCTQSHRGRYTNLCVDDVVVFLHPQARGRWPLGRIGAVFPGKDGQVRTVDVILPQCREGREYFRLSDKVLRRDVSSVALLLPANSATESPARGQLTDAATADAELRGTPPRTEETEQEGCDREAAEKLAAGPPPTASPSS